MNMTYLTHSHSCRSLILCLLMLVLFGGMAMAQTTFTAKTVEGVELTYKVLSEDNKTCEVSKAPKEAIVVTIPDKANGYSVTGIGSYAFYYFSDLTSITIPNSVARIGDCAFLGCSGLNTIKVDSSNIVYDSRNNCNAIIESNTNELICGCKNTVIPNSVTSIGDYAFYECSDLTYVTIGNSVTDIGESAFEGCIDLTYVTIGNSVTNIGESAFEGCIGLTFVTIPNSVMRIGDCAFLECSGLKSIKVDSGNTVFDSRNNCNAIIESNTNELIYGCKNTVIPNSVTSIGDCAFYYCSGLISVTIPNSVTSIGYETFYGCSGLISVMIGNSVTSIGDHAFQSCSGLTSVTIPNSVMSIGESAFDSCVKLSEIKALSKEPATIKSNTFDESTYTSGKLIIPVGAKQKYKNADGWNQFNNIEEDDDTPVVIAISLDVNPKTLNFEVNDTKSEKLTVTTNANTWQASVKDAEGNSIDWVELTALSGISEIENETYVTVKANTTSADRTATITFTVKNEKDEEITCEVTVTQAAMTQVAQTTFTAETVEGVELTYKVLSEDDKTCEVSKAPKDAVAVTIPDVVDGYNVTNIGWFTFSGCNSLTSITIPNSVTSIGNSAFFGCNGLTSVTIPNSVTSIGDYAFQNCSGLTSITIPNSVTNIGWNAFRDCSGLAFVTIPNSVTRIGNFVFYGCSGLTSVTIPNSVTSIGDYAFKSCEKLTEIKTLSKEPATIGNTFDISTYTSGKLIVPGGTKQKYKKADGWNKFNIIKEDDDTPVFIAISLEGVELLYKVLSEDDKTCEVSKAPKDAIVVTIPDVVNGYSVTSIGENAFVRCIGLSSVAIPNNVTRIEDNAFWGCSGLTSVTIGDGVTSLGDYAFSGCSGLTSFTISNSVTSIGSNAFSGCSGLTSVTIGDGVTSLGDHAFSGCSALTSVHIYSLEAWCKINFGSSSNPLIYAHHLYQNGEEVRNLVIPGSVAIINFLAFYGCSGLTSVTIPSTVKSIGRSAFAMCSGLTSVTIPNSVTSIGEYAFSGCSGLTSVTIPNSVTRIGEWVFQNCSGLTSVTIPNSVTSIGNSAFYGCSGLTSVTIGNGVTSIGKYAFYRCIGLASVTIPNSVTSIGEYAFSGCSGLSEIKALSEEPATIYSDTFDKSTYSSGTLIVPVGAKQKYIDAEGWKQFVTIEEEKDTTEPFISVITPDFADFTDKAIVTSNGIIDTYHVLEGYRFSYKVHVKDLGKTWKGSYIFNGGEPVEISNDNTVIENDTLTIVPVDNILRASEKPVTFSIQIENATDKSRTVEIMVYAKPEITDADGMKSTEEESIVNAIRGNRKSLSVAVNDIGFGKWSYEWFIDDNKTSQADNNITLTVGFDGIEYEKEYTVRLRVAHIPQDGIYWLGPEDFYFKMKFLWSQTDLPDITFNVLKNGSLTDTGNDVLQDDKVQVKLDLVGYKESDYAEKFLWKWDDGQYGTVNPYAVPLSSGNTKVKVALTYKDSPSSTPKEEEVTLRVWPIIEVTNKDKLKMIDMNRNLAEITNGIRSGNTITLSPEPVHEGGYGDGSWNLIIKSAENDVSINNGVITLSGEKPTATRITYVLQNMHGNVVMKETPILEKDLVVYPKPAIPTSLALKGNGNSGTWYVKGFTDNYNELEFGNDKTGNVEIDAHADDWSWIISSRTKNPTDKHGYYVYTKHDYGNYVVITSDKMYEGKSTATPWDGSTYGFVTPEVQEALQHVVAGQFNINGMQTNGMVRGLNIIRMADGTVKKIFRK